MSNEPSGGPVNNGFQQSGGNSQIGNQAIGAGARAVAGDIGFRTLVPAPATQASDLLTLVERLLEEHRAELPDQSGTQVELRRIREELGEAEPQPGVLRRGLERLTSFVEPVTPLVVAVGRLSQAVQDAVGH